MSLEEPIGGDDKEDEAMCLHDVLAGREEDPSMAASRRLDWGHLMAQLDSKAREVLNCLASGSYGRGFKRILWRPSILWADGIIANDTRCRLRLTAICHAHTLS
jgi:hypothetical protein